MKTKIKKVIKCKAYTKEDFEQDEERRVKRRITLRADFRKIEDAPITKQEREIQKKIVVDPIGVSHLVAEEQKEFLQRMFASDLLAASEKTCIELTFDGLRPADIAKRLGLTHATVLSYLHRAVSKLRQVVEDTETDKTKNK